MKKIMQYILVYLGVIVLFNVLLWLVCLFPSQYIYQNVKMSSDILLQEGSFFCSFFDWNGSIIDNYSDVLCVNEAYSIDNTQPVESYMKARKNYQKGLTQTELLDTHGDLYSYSLDLKDENRRTYTG